MKTAALYVFYSSPRTCARRVKLMRSFSPGSRFYGICTDRPENLDKYKPVWDELDDAWEFPHVSPLWHWHNLDKVVCTWFVKQGVKLEFDRLLVLDWDVLLLSPVAGWACAGDEKTVKFIDVKHLDQPNVWTNASNQEFAEFSAKYKSEKGQDPVVHSAYLFAYAISRRAMEECAQEVLDYSGYCEYRLPTLLKSRGYELENLPRPADWGRLANVNGRSIAGNMIREEFARPDGYRLFHPVYEPYQNKDLGLSFYDRIAEGSLYRNVTRSMKETLKRNRMLKEFFAARLLARCKKP